MVDNSVNKQFADKIFYTKAFDEVTGFVTVKLSKKFATIGLIAVSKNFQGKGIGKILICEVEEYCINNNVFEANFNIYMLTHNLYTIISNYINILFFLV